MYDMSKMPIKIGEDVLKYIADSWRRQVLYCDVMRERSKMYEEHKEQGRPPVLDSHFHYELIMDGREFEKPVNYSLVRIIDRRNDDKGDKNKKDRRQKNMKGKNNLPPVVVVDPRAGHGPGIGGSKRDSQIGIALDNGHPVYFIIFYVFPEENQTIEDVVIAKSIFMEKVNSLHKKAPKPIVIGNCQAGWAMAMCAAYKPELFGALEINGAPLSYNAGVAGSNPMRSRGAVMGGLWPVMFLSDLGNGLYDGAYLVGGFEMLNLLNTLINKNYRLYKNVDKERERFLDFEKWWGGFYFLTREEIEFIVRDLFIGNKLEKGEIEIQGKNLDLKSLPTVFINCSKGDNITPPEQALSWIMATYKKDSEIDKPIFFSVDPNVGHLAIFVSSDFNNKVHNDFLTDWENWGSSKPGIYEVIFKEAEKENGEVILDENNRPFYGYVLKKRSLRYMRKEYGTVNNKEIFQKYNERSQKFAEFYENFVRPYIQSFSNEKLALAIREFHPLRLQQTIFSENINPMMWWIKSLAPVVREQETERESENYFTMAEENMISLFGDGIKNFQGAYDKWLCDTFRTFYS